MGIIENLLTSIRESKPVYDAGFDDLLRSLMEIAGMFLVVMVFA